MIFYMLETFFTILITFSSKIGYWGIFLLMTIESSFIPFPSEIVIPPAAYLAQKGEMNLYLIIVFGILGSLIGAIINYYLARSLGRSVVYYLVKKKIFKVLLITREKVERAENYFLRMGKISTFIGRLIPVIRQLISLPAGFSKMPLTSFIFYTGLGSGIWVIILAVAGYAMGQNIELLMHYYEEFKYYIIGLFMIFMSVYLYFSLKKGPKPLHE